MDKKINDLTGKQFERLLVIEKTNKRSGHNTVWLCKCQCGKEKNIASSALLSGATKSCGCIVIENNKSRSLDLLNNRFGRLLVLKQAENRLNNNIIWECNCDCGNLCKLSTAALRGGTLSCGCLSKEITSKRCLLDLTNKRFGRLLVIGRTNKPSYGSGVIWSCLCDCNNTKEVSRTHLLDGHTKSCGCLNVEVSKERHRQYRISKGFDPDIFMATEDEQIRGQLSKSGLKGEVLKRDNFKCVLCLAKGNIHVHHIIPKIEDVTKFFDLTNMITLCIDCHKKAHLNVNYLIDKQLQSILIKVIDELYIYSA